MCPDLFCLCLGIRPIYRLFPLQQSNEVVYYLELSGQVTSEAVYQLKLFRHLPRRLSINWICSDNWLGRLNGMVGTMHVWRFLTIGTARTNGLETRSIEIVLTVDPETVHSMG